jgi:hypothetical protein
VSRLGLREKALLVLLAVLGLVAVWRLWSMAEDEPTAARMFRGTSLDLELARQIIGELPDLNELERPRVSSYEYWRDLFCCAHCRKEVRPATQTLAKRGAPENPRDPLRPEPRPPRPNPKAASHGPPNPRLTYLGYVGLVSDPIAVFKVKGSRGKILLAKTGDVLQAEFVVTSIDSDRVELGFTRNEYRQKTTTLSMEGAQGTASGRTG